MGDRDIMNVAAVELRMAAETVMHLQDVLARLLDATEFYERVLNNPEGPSRAVDLAIETLVTTHMKNADGRWVRR